MNYSRNDEKSQKCLEKFKSQFDIDDGDHYFLVQVFDLWRKKKEKLNNNELNNWCR